MMNVYEMRNRFELKECNMAISREDFEKFFNKTEESVCFTFNGWDGKAMTVKLVMLRFIRQMLMGLKM